MIFLKMMSKRENMTAKEIKEKIKNGLTNYFYKATGVGHINGGYCEITNLKIKDMKNENPPHYEVSLKIKYGVQDCGDGCSHHSIDTYDAMKIDKKTFLILPHKPKEDREYDGTQVAIMKKLKITKIRTIEGAKRFIREILHTDVEIIRKYKYRLSNDEFDEYLKDDKELIRYANEFKEEVELMKE